MRFDRPIGLLLLLWPTWWGLWAAANGLPSLKNALIFTAGVVVMRSAGCIINDYFDRDIDPLVQRTRHRPLASGELTARQALGGFFLLMLVALALVSLTNPLTIGLAVVGALLATTYPLFKRFTHWPQAVLGLAFAWAIPMAYAAEIEALPVGLWWWVAINVVWVLIYDTEYAMADRADDLQVGVKSTAIGWGRFDLTGLALGMGILISLLIAHGLSLDAGWVWWFGTAVVTMLLIRQWWRVRGRQPEACFQAFLSNHWVGLVIFLMLVLTQLA